MMIHFIKISFLLLLKESCGQETFSIPNTLEALKGSCVDIPCHYRANTPPPYHVMWYVYDQDQHHVIFDSHDEAPLLARYQNRTSLVKRTPFICSLRIDHVTSEDGKYYYPSVNNHSMQIGLGIKINVIDFPPRPSIQGQGVMVEGRLSVVTCETEHTCSSGGITFKLNSETDNRLTKKQEQYPANPTAKVSVDFRFTPKYVDDGKGILCEVTYPNGQTSRSLSINVNYPPKNTKAALLGDPDIQEGDNVTLSCNSKAYPDIRTYLWFKGMGPGGPAGEGPEITLRNVTWPMEPYFCTAENTLGTGKSNRVVIPVKHAAKGVQIIKYEHGDGTVELKCQVSSSNPAVTHFTWVRNAIPLITQNNPTLSLNNTDMGSGEYKCIAHNLIGNASSDAKISIVMKAAPTVIDEGSKLTPSLYGIIALLPILLLLVFVLRKLKIKNQGNNNAETQCAEPIYSEIKETEAIAEDADIKDSESPDNPYTALEKRESLTYEELKGSHVTDNPYTALSLQDTDPYGEIKGSHVTDNPYTALSLQDTHPYGEIKPRIPQRSDSE